LQHLATIYDKIAQNPDTEKSLEPLRFQGFEHFSALGELGGATGGFQAVLLNAKILNHLKNGAFLRVLAKLSPKLSPASKPASILAF
jgi:hypothetical protein